MRQQADLRDVVGLHDLHRMRGVGLGTALVAENPERQHRGGDRTVFGDKRIDQRAVGREIVGIEGRGMHRRGARRADRVACSSRLCGSRAASTTVAPGASRAASSAPISLRPPKITTTSVPVSPTPGDYPLR